MQMNGDHMTSPGLGVTRVSHQGLLPPLYPYYNLSGPVQHILCFGSYSALCTVHCSLCILHFSTQCNLDVDQIQAPTVHNSTHSNTGLQFLTHCRLHIA